MATEQSHLSLSVIIAIGYCAAGVVFFDLFPETAVLAGIVIVATGMLPNIDARGSAPAKELASLLAAVSPLVILEYVPAIRQGGVVRICLVVVTSYLFTRIIVNRFLDNNTVHRGIMHSVPAAIITSELTYLLFQNLLSLDRLYLSAAALVGYGSHLFIDAYGNMDLGARLMGKAEHKPPVLKFGAGSTSATFIAYACMLALGWYIAKDFYPGLRFYAGVKY